MQKEQYLTSVEFGKFQNEILAIHLQTILKYSLNVLPIYFVFKYCILDYWINSLYTGCPG